MKNCFWIRLKACFRFIASLTAIFFVSCTSIEKSIPSHVRSTGAMHKMMMSGDNSGKLDISAIKSRNLYGVGPLEGLKGEITILDGKPYIGTVSSSGKPVVQKKWTESAVFFVHAESRNWKTMKVDGGIGSKKELDKFIADALKLYSIDKEEKAIFKVRAKARSLAYHIMNLKSEARISHQSHRSAKVMYELEGSNIEIVGFWAPKKMMGVYSHMGDRTHLHFVSKDEKHSGHIDSLSLEPGSEILIAIKKEQTL